MNESQPHESNAQCPGCIDAEGAWIWVGVLCELALEGEPDADRDLVRAIDHALAVQRWELTS